MEASASASLNEDEVPDQFNDQPFHGGYDFGNEEYSSDRLWASVLRRMLGKNIEVDIIYLAFIFLFLKLDSNQREKLWMLIQEMKLFVLGNYEASK